MLYFVKRNHKLKEFKDYYKNLENLCALLDKLNPDLTRAKILLATKSKKDPIKLCLGDYLHQVHSFSYSEFKELDLTVINSFKKLKTHLVDFKIILENLKNYESFQGRIKFRQFANLFNFEDFIYEDKQFQYSIISNYNKRLIPEFVSASFAIMVYENFVGDEVRRNMEQYFIAIMSNMNYQNFAHISQLKKELETVLSADKNIFYVVGASPQTFDEQEYVELLNERIERADSFITTGIETNNQPTKLWQKSNIPHKYGKEIKDSDYFSHSDKECVLGNPKDGKNPTSKLTAENLEYIYSDIRERKKQGKLKSYNLFLVTSTFHVLKTAIEIEKHFYNAIEDKPDNIIFIGNEKFFDLAHNKINCQSKDKGTFHKKKLKSFLYELFLHTLDKNAVDR